MATDGKSPAPRPQAPSAICEALARFKRAQPNPANPMPANTHGQPWTELPQPYLAQYGALTKLIQR